MIRLVVVDSNPIIWEAVPLLLADAPDIHIVANVERGAELYALLARTAVDVVLLEGPGLPREGLDLLPRLRQDWPGLRAVIFSSHNDLDCIGLATERGAVGYLRKFGLPEAMLADAIRTVVQGGRYIGPPREFSKEAVRRFLNPPPASPSDPG